MIRQARRISIRNEAGTLPVDACVTRSLSRALSGALRRLSHPVRADAERHGVAIHAYRGYGSRDRLFLMGRVLRQPRLAGLRRSAHRPTLIDFLRRTLRRGVRGARVVAEYGGARAEAETDADGYFRVQLCAREGLLPGEGWQSVQLRLEAPARAAGATAEAAVYLRPAASRCVVISDIDDTVVETGVASKLRMFWNLFFEDVESRVAYPGVAAFYRQLHAGASGDQDNPMLYVSRGPWAIYEILDLFFQRHRIPVGPILFLRDWGMTLQRPLPPPAREHKLALIRDMLAVYDDLPMVLIGDSGQRDPEIYARVVEEHPARIKAIYIRNVGRDPARDAAIRRLAEDLAAAGADLQLADDTVAMARHAAAEGLVGPEVPDLVRSDRARDEAMGAG